MSVISNGPTRREAAWVLGLGLCSTVLGGSTQAAPQGGGLFPSDAGLFNVRDFGAVGDGVADDTDAILRAISKLPTYVKELPYLTRIIYFPAGIYRVLDTILRKDADGTFQPDLILIGENRTTTTIKLTNGAPGFNNPAHPKAVVFTSSGLRFMKNPTDGGRDYATRGEGNEAFGNTVENLTIDVGNGNAGAIGIDFLANNVGAVRNVTITAPGRAAVGLSMARRWPGPALIDDVTIAGFDIGIDVAYSNYSMTLDRVRVEGTKLYGIRNNSNVISFHDVQVIAEGGHGLANIAPDGLIVGIERGHRRPWKERFAEQRGHQFQERHI